MNTTKGPDFSTFSKREVVSLIFSAMSYLKNQDVIRTGNALAGDYAEYLVAAALNGQLAANSQKAWDVLLANGEKIQVKSRRVSDPVIPGQLQLGVFRSFDFDFAVIVLLRDDDAHVVRAAKVARHVIESSTSYQKRVNGNVLSASAKVMSHPDAIDLTALLQAAQA